MANSYVPTCNVKCESYRDSLVPKIYEHLVRGTMSEYRRLQNCAIAIIIFFLSGDCILGAEGKFIRAHKLILSISSEYFEVSMP